MLVFGKPLHQNLNYLIQTIYRSPLHTRPVDCLKDENPQNPFSLLKFQKKTFLVQKFRKIHFYYSRKIKKPIFCPQNTRKTLF